MAGDRAGTGSRGARGDSEATVRSLRKFGSHRLSAWTAAALAVAASAALAAPALACAPGTQEVRSDADFDRALAGGASRIELVQGVTFTKSHTVARRVQITTPARKPAKLCGALTFTRGASGSSLENASVGCGSAWRYTQRVTITGARGVSIRHARFTSAQLVAQNAAGVTVTASSFRGFEGQGAARPVVVKGRCPGSAFTGNHVTVLTRHAAWKPASPTLVATDTTRSSGTVVSETGTKISIDCVGGGAKQQTPAPSASDTPQPSEAASRQSAAGAGAQQTGEESPRPTAASTGGSAQTTPSTGAGAASPSATPSTARATPSAGRSLVAAPAQAKPTGLAQTGATVTLIAAAALVLLAAGAVALAIAGRRRADR